MDDVKVKAGKLFCLSEGEYSDYGYVGHFLALEDIDAALIAKVKARCLERVKNGEGEYYGGPVDLEDEHEVNHGMRILFVPELVRSGAVMDIDCTEIHLGSYGQLEI